MCLSSPSIPNTFRSQPHKTNLPSRTTWTSASRRRIQSPEALNKVQTLKKVQLSPAQKRDSNNRWLLNHSNNRRWLSNSKCSSKKLSNKCKGWPLNNNSRWWSNSKISSKWQRLQLIKQAKRILVWLSRLILLCNSSYFFSSSKWYSSSNSSSAYNKPNPSRPSNSYSCSSNSDSNNSMTPAKSSTLRSSTTKFMSRTSNTSWIRWETKKCTTTCQITNRSISKPWCPPSS